jgi:hypothetical protein
MAGSFFFAGVFAFTFAALLVTPEPAIDHVSAVKQGEPLQAAIEAVYPAPADPATGVTSDAPALQMIMVRVKDGKPVMACVDSKEAATRFATAPIEKIGGSRIAEEK